LLYDANLLGIKPDTHEIVLADAADVEPYAGLVDAMPRLREPDEASLRPDDELLDLHYQRFVLRNAAA
jgi:hypothetical protein